MKKMALMSAICITVVAITTGIVLTAAQKVDLVPCPYNYLGPTFPPGGAFVIFNNGDEGDYNLEVRVSLKAVEPYTAYDIHLFVDGSYYGFLGTVSTNKKGNTNLQQNALLSEGGHILAIDITKFESGLDVYETPGIHEPPPGQGTYMIFK
jgi:hypothetical protein